VHTAQGRTTRLRSYLTTSFKTLGRESIMTRDFQVAIPANAQPPARSPDDPEALSLPYRRAAYVVDGKRTQTAARAGTLPPGFMVTPGSHLRIV
jgi:hypothetical protein